MDPEHDVEGAPILKGKNKIFALDNDNNVRTKLCVWQAVEISKNKIELYLAQEFV